ncbi:MAG: DNA-3-methyladenine glycosylase I [Pontibacterium sp.]
MKSFQWIYEHVRNHLPDQDIEALMPEVLTPDQLKKIPDDRVLSMMSLRIFRSGLKHSLVDARWPAFEDAFFSFDPQKISLMSDEQLENLMQNEKLIRHWGKIKATRINAMMVCELAEKQGSCANFIAQWPQDDIISLWALLKKQGAHLGGNSGAYFLRMLGKDTFVLTDDVVAALKAQGIIDKKPTAKRDLQTVQAAFNQWQAESGRPMSHISRLLSHTVGW